jgi:hypothetical protein
LWQLAAMAAADSAMLPGSPTFNSTPEASPAPKNHLSRPRAELHSRSEIRNLAYLAKMCSSTPDLGCK